MKQDVSTASPEKDSDKWNIAASVTLDPKSSFPPKNKQTYTLFLYSQSPKEFRE